jgi:hypothetical protein
MLDFPQFCTPEENLGFIRDNMNGITCEPPSIIERLQAYTAVGVDEIMIQWFFMEKLGGIQILAKEVLPALQR